MSANSGGPREGMMDEVRGFSVYDVGAALALGLKIFKNSG